MTSRSRKRRSAGGSACAVVQDNKPTATAFVSSDREELTAEELDFLLLKRGWVAVDRAQNYAMYDWPPSAPHAQHDITYLTNCRLERPLQLPTVSRIDRER
jgi:hypothetical protein